MHHCRRDSHATSRTPIYANILQTGCIRVYCSWFWVVLVGFVGFEGGFGWFWVVLLVVLGGFGWFWLVLVGFGWFWVVPCFSNYVQNGANATHPKQISIKFTTNPRTKQKNAVTDTQYIQQSVHTYYKLLNNQSIKASICPFFVLHQWLLHAKLTKPREALTRCYVTSHW